MNHTDVESVEYKNHQLLLENIDLLKKEIMSLKSFYLESHVRQIDENRKTSKRADEIEENTKRMWDCIRGLDIRVENLYKITPDRKPYKCPCCSGNGHRDFSGLDCKSCEGTGIVWG